MGRQPKKDLMMLKTLRTRLRQSPANRGFTLTELVISAVLVMVVVMLGGYGMSIMFRSNRDQAVQADRRADLNRAVEYISSEIRESSQILDPSTVNIPNDISVQFSNLERRLAIEVVPEGSPDIVNVIYFSAEPQQSWLGDSDTVLYRYEEGQDEAKPLVDFLDNVEITEHDSRRIEITLVGKLRKDEKLANSTYKKTSQVYVRSASATPDP